MQDMARGQKITSAATSLNQVPRLFRAVPLARGSINLDVGGGKYDKATDYLHSLGVHNFVWDPYNRSDEHNDRVYDLLVVGSFADTATLSNVLNVIQHKRDRIAALAVARQSVGSTGVCYITVYEGDRSGKGKKTSKGFQLNRPVKSYVSEVKEVFRLVDVIRGGIIVARDPKD